MTRLELLFRDFVMAINEVVLEQLDTELANHLVETMFNIQSMLLKKVE